MKVNQRPTDVALCHPSKPSSCGVDVRTGGELGDTRFYYVNDLCPSCEMLALALVDLI